MIAISNLEYLEAVSLPNKVIGKVGLFDDVSIILGTSFSDFFFDSLVVGTLGAYGGGITNVLTTADPGNYSVGFAFQYQSTALGELPPAPVSAPRRRRKK